MATTGSQALAWCSHEEHPARVSGAGACSRRRAYATPPHELRCLVLPVEHAMDGPESRPALLLIRGACARHDGLPGSLSGTSFADASGGAGDRQTSLSLRARGPHACLLLRWGGTGKVESREKETGVPHCSSVPILGGLRS